MVVRIGDGAKEAIMNKLRGLGRGQVGGEGRGKTTKRREGVGIDGHGGGGRRRRT